MFITRRLTLAFTVLQAFSIAMAAGDVYPPPEKAAHDLQLARQRAKTSGKLLMVIFGGNWCEDCRVLHARLSESPTREYVEKHFEVVSINIGEMNANLQIAKDLGVTLSKGVPAAGFFDADGKRVGLTNNGELEPARQYDAQQVLRFLRKVAEEHVVEKPK
jgi:thioredoxin 1